jgi:hypothetical protein
MGEIVLKHGAVLFISLRDGSGKFEQALRTPKHWPNKIEATVNFNKSFGSSPGLSFQLTDVAIRSACNRSNSRPGSGSPNELLLVSSLRVPVLRCNIRRKTNAPDLIDRVRPFSTRNNSRDGGSRLVTRWLITIQDIDVTRCVTTKVRSRGPRDS